MIQKVAMPRFGQTMEEGTIERWAKQIGDDVEIGEVLLEITTDKATLEVEAFASGVLRQVLAAEGDVVKCGRVIALVGDADDELPEIDPNETIEAAAPAEEKAAAAPEAPAKPAAASAPTPGPAPAPAAAPAAMAPGTAVVGKDRLFASPRAKRRAQEEKVAIDFIRGSGPNGRVVEADVIDYAAQAAECKASPLAREVAFQRGVDLLAVKGSGPFGRITKEDVADAPPALPSYDLVEPLSAMRRVVANRMFESKRDIPHFYLMIEMDMTECMAYRAELNAPGDVKVSYNDILMKACAMAFRDNRGMLAAWGGDKVVIKTQINIGLAVSIDDGLMVPVVKDVDRKTLAQISVESAELVKRARSKKLTPDEYEDGRLTISNLGMMDIDNFIPIVNPGEAAIMGVGRIKEKVVAIDGGIRVRNMMNVTLSADHRVVDGAVAATFLKQVKDLMEAPRQIG